MHALRRVLACSLLVWVAGCGGAGPTGHYVPAVTDGGDCDAHPVICGGCASDADCAGATPRCDVKADRCVACLPDNDNCPAGHRCVDVNSTWSCVVKCQGAADCKMGDGGAGSMACCSSACIDTANDASNCGSCANACAPLANAAPACASGMCGLGACKSGFADCDKLPVNGCETATATDAKNCGGCGTVCTLAHASPACDKGHCTVSSCAMGFGDCDGDATNGCEADVSSDINNCGGCKKACTAGPNATPVCTAGACAVGACQPGFGDCDKNAQNGCETVTSTDAANCGACGMACALPNATPGCKNGGCVVTKCDANFADCDGNAQNGCESTLQSDPANCGACGNRCGGAPNATVACIGGQCVIGQCKQGFSDCNRNLQDGCEADLSSLNNCGACNNACGAVQNGTPGCNGGMCGVAACDPLWGDCDGSAQNGCEHSLAFDTGNCGGCGHVCAVANGTPGCANGNCTVVSCNNGFRDCDGQPGNGCEANLASDNNNCGGCGIVCGGGTVCQAGTCQQLVRCTRVGWKLGSANWACPNGYRLPTTLEWNLVAPCVLQADTNMFGTNYDVAVSVGGCNCKWNANWCGQPSIETIRQGRMCGDYNQLQICVR